MYGLSKGPGNLMIPLVLRVTQFHSLAFLFLSPFPDRAVDFKVVMSVHYHSM